MHQRKDRPSRRSPLGRAVAGLASPLRLASFLAAILGAQFLLWPVPLRDSLGPGAAVCLVFAGAWTLGFTTRQ